MLCRTRRGSQPGIHERPRICSRRRHVTSNGDDNHAANVRHIPALPPAGKAPKLVAMSSSNQQSDGGELATEINRLLTAARLHAQRVYSTELDFSERSIADLDLILARMSEMIPRGRLQKLLKRQPAPEQIAGIALMYGIYLGEVLRRKLGGEWRVEMIEGSKAVALRLPAGLAVYPASETYRRLTKPEEAGVEEFFQKVCETAAKGST